MTEKEISLKERKDLPPRKRSEAIARQWLKRGGVSPERKPAPESPPNEDQFDLVSEAYDLFVEKNELNGQITRAIRGMMEPVGDKEGADNKWEDYNKRFSVAKDKLQDKLSGGDSTSLWEKKKLLLNGKVTNVMPTITDYEQIDLQKTKISRERIGEIDTRLDQVFSNPNVYESFIKDFSRQVRLRQAAREVMNLRDFARQVDVTAYKMARQAMLEGRGLNSSEEQIIAENKELAEVAGRRSDKLLKNSEVSYFVRDAELKEYQEQWRKGRFVRIKSREEYLKILFDQWTKGERFLSTGPSGTGKTELIKFAAKELFGVEPESVTGHRDLSIYELLGKTGFNVKEGDVFRPAPLIRAMTGRGGKGLPFLFDEMNRAPNESLMGIKTIMNSRPGDTVKVQTDSQGEFKAGEDYSFTAAINVKNEKHTTATKLDPAIERMFAGKSHKLDYMPNLELYDIALAVLRDRRGGIPVTSQDANKVLKNLCDATSWIQNVYQGKRIDLDNGEYIKARGQASTGEQASIADAILDPGVVIEWVEGYKIDKRKGMSFEQYLNEKIKIFINNENYPEEDRYYLTEIFALKGFLKEQKAEEFLVTGIDQGTLEKWGAKGKVNRETGYISAREVARLDPYNRKGQSVKKAAEDLLNENGKAGEEDSGDKSEKAELLKTSAKEHLKDFLNYEIQVPEPPQDCLDFLVKKEREGAKNLQAVYYPGKDVEFEKTSPYPGWVKRPNDFYWENRATGKIPDNPKNHRNMWIVIDTTQKPLYSNGNQMYSEDPFNLGEIISGLRASGTILKNTTDPRSRFGISHDEITQHVLPALAAKEGLDKSIVLLPTEEQFNIIGNMYHPEWGEANTSEWLDDVFGAGGRLFGGHSDKGGLSYVNFTFWASGDRLDSIGFRPLVSFPV